LASEGANAGPTRGRDEELLAAVRAFQRGERGGFDRLYRRLWGPVVLRASRMGLGYHEAEEIAQRTLVRVYLYAGRASFDGPQRLWGWVYTIASREIYKLWRKKRPDVVSEEALEVWATLAADASSDPAAAAASAEALADVEQCIAKLDEAERMIALGVLLGGLTFRGAAKAHGLSLGQFKHRYEKALGKVRDCMRARGHDVE
jgi:RNA polymerase sigma factor (sigma-70 family)